MRLLALSPHPLRSPPFLNRLASPFCSVTESAGIGIPKELERNGTTMKPIISILTLQLCMTAFVSGQMPGMTNHPSQTPDDSNASNPATNPSKVTFTKDVAPIVQEHCQACHRPGEGTPFSMLTYEDARPWATAMKRMVVSRAMPPWFEDGHTEKFENNRLLTQAQIDTIAAW